jgi:hypothetical protein
MKSVSESWHCNRLRFAQGWLFAVTLSEAKGLALLARRALREESGSEEKANARFLVVRQPTGASE